jgi:hypothetical protein
VGALGAGEGVSDLIEASHDVALGNGQEVSSDWLCGIGQPTAISVSLLIPCS